MMWTCVRFFVFTWIVAICTANHTEYSDCSAPDDKDVTISVFSSRNKTRQLKAQVKLEKGSCENLGKTSLEINVEPDSECLQSQRDPPRPFYELVPGLGYYKFHNRGMTWFNAKLACESEGAHLAIINSRKEVDVLKELRDRLPFLYNGDWRDDTVYIGITDKEVENTWVTIFGEPLSRTGFSEWDVGLPNKGVKGNCGIFRPSTAKLHDCDCNAVIGFYCEREL